MRDMEVVRVREEDTKNRSALPVTPDDRTRQEGC